jgi:N-acetylmannosamine-6-phosphate 2-epimerase/N-acetylmannosamine kinase
MIERLRGGLIVSCQAHPDDVIYGPDGMASMAGAAQAGGAVGIRANGVADISAIRRVVSLPIIGIDKQNWGSYGIRITPTLEAARQVAEAGADIIAIDATKRGPDEGRPAAPDLIRAIKHTLNRPVMADISTYEEGLAAAAAGADLVATTLSGYTPYSPALKGPDFDLLARLVAALHVPVIAEGRISTPDEARHVLELGGYAIVVGSMVTRPRWITEQYMAALNAFHKAQAARVIGIDIGGTKIALGVFEEASTTPVYHDTTPTRAAEGGEAVLARVIRLIWEVVAQCGPVAAIGIGTGGEPDANGRIAYATGFMPGWMGLPVGERIAAEFGLPVRVENDGGAAALGEALHGAGRGYASVLAVTVGTGIGGGLALNGRIYAGAGRAALALGHLPVVRDGRLCTCGQRGCLEAYASGPALVHAYRGRGGVAESGEEVTAAAQRGDPHALDALREIGEWVGLGVAHALNLINPAVVVIGGGVASIGEAFFGPLREAVQRYAYPTVRHTPIVAAQLGAAAGMVGAADLARQTLIDGP